MRLAALHGPNFSGRTHRLREWVGLPSDPNEEPVCNGTAYIGLDPAANLSGLAPSVRAEFELLAANSLAYKKSVEALESLSFAHCLDRNPFTLSGGEQVVVSILAALAAKPRRLAIDCAMEQLSPITRSKVIEYLDHQDVELMIADNRLDEWFDGDKESCTAPVDVPCFHLNESIPCHSTDMTVELMDLGFAYVKSRPVFEGLNIILSPGRLHLLKGPNGSGKSTLSRILAGLLKPTSGEIRLNGKTIQPWKQPGLLTSYHYQDPDLQMFATRVAVQLPSKSEHIATTFGLNSFINEHPLDLPYVLRKRLAIGCAIASPASLVALDEPTLGQDNAAAQALRSICSSRAGVVISHSNIFNGLPEIYLGREIE